MGQATDTPRPDFGDPEAEFRPTFGQTAAGMLLTCSIVAAAFMAATLDEETDLLRSLAMVATGATGVGLACRVYGLRKWRLWVCPNGLVQRRVWVVDEIAWSEVREAVMERHVFIRTPDNVTLMRAGAGKNVTIRPINCAKWRQALAAVLKALRKRHIPVRTVLVKDG